MMFPGVNDHNLPNMDVHAMKFDDVEYRGLVRCDLKRKRDDHHGNSCLAKSKVLIQPEDTELDFDSLCVMKKKRSNRGKVSKFCAVPDLNLACETLEDNEEEAALGLIMLSSGFTTWDDFVSGFDPSGDDPLICKAVALNRIDTKSVIEIDSGVSEIEKGSELIGVESGNVSVLGSIQTESGKTGSGNPDAELGIRVDSGYVELKNFSFGNELKKPANNVFEITTSGFDIRKENKFSASTHVGVELGNRSVFESVEADSGIKSGETSSGNQDIELGIKLNSSSLELGNFTFQNEFKKPVDYVFETTSSGFKIRKQNKFSTSEKISFVSESSGNCDEKTEIKCKTCDKKFSSFQALGGHRAGKCKEKSEGIKGSCEEKKNKSIHQCTICFKVFPTGQALGGHKRAHFIGPESKSEEGMVVMSRESAIDVPDFSSLKKFDLSLGLKPWWSEPVMI